MSGSSQAGPSSEDASRPPLGAGDLEILALLADGLSLETVARRVGLSERTVRRRCRQVCDRLGVDAPIQAVVWAVRRRLL